MKKLMFALLISTVAVSAYAEEGTPDNPVMELPKGNVCQLKGGKTITNGSCRSPRADALVRKSNELVKGDPTCKQLLEASTLLNRATEIYIAVGSISGEVRDISRAGTWTEDRARDGKCRGGADPYAEGVHDYSSGLCYRARPYLAPLEQEKLTLWDQGFHDAKEKDRNRVDRSACRGTK